MAVDIARGRDHGLSPYHVYLNMSIPGGYRIESWNDLTGIFSYDVRTPIPIKQCTTFMQYIYPFQSILLLKTVYKSAKDIDLFVGLIMEMKLFSYAGHVTKYILEEQFYRFKFGDQYFYSFANSRNPFTEGMPFVSYLIFSGLHFHFQTKSKRLTRKSLQIFYARTRMFVRCYLKLSRLKV